MIDKARPYLENPVLIAGAIMVISLFSLVFALIGQYVFGLQPCPLCIYQRWPYVFAALLGLAGILIGRAGMNHFAALQILFASVAFMSGASIAFYHVGVEQHWWKSAVDACEVSILADAADMDIESLMEKLTQTQAARCDEISWSFLGLTMAAYNTMLSAFLAVISMASAILIFRRQK